MSEFEFPLSLSLSLMSRGMILNFQHGGIVSAIYDASLTDVSDWRHNRVRVVYDSGSGYYEAGPYARPKELDFA